MYCILTLYFNTNISTDHRQKQQLTNSARMSSGQRRESILELAKLMDSLVRVKCLGGRELQGILRGYDELVNLVLDDCDEFLRGTA